MKFRSLLLKVRWADWLIFLFFLITPLVATSLFVDSHIVPKWVWLYFSFSVLMFLFFLIGFKIEVPLLYLKKTNFYLILILFLLIKISQLIIHPIAFEAFAFFDFILFIFIILVSYNIPQKTEDFLENLQIPFLISNFLVSARSLFQFYEERFLNSNFSHEVFASSFGNVNLLAEFYLINIPLLIYYFKKKNDDLNVVMIQNILFIINIFLLYWISSRSAYLALVFCLFYNFYASDLNLKKKLLKLNFITFLLIIGFHFIWSHGELNMLVDSKSASNFSRKNLLVASFHLIKNNPLGIGTEKFEFAVAPYRLLTDEPIKESMLDKTPHNEFFRWTIELGWAPLFLIFFTLFKILKLINTLKQNKAHNYTLYISLFGIFIFQALFQFPLMNAYTFFSFSFWLGLVFKDNVEMFNSNLTFNLLKKSNLNNTLNFNLYLGRKILFFIFVISFIFTFAYSTSEYYKINSDSDISKISLSCKLMPSNWRSCVHEAEIYFNEKKFEKSIDLLKTELQNHPDNFIALKFLTLNYIALKNNEAACKAALHYEHLLGGKGQFIPFTNLICKSNYQPRI